MKNYGDKSARSQDEPGWYQFMGEHAARRELKRETKRLIRRLGRQQERSSSAADVH